MPRKSYSDAQRTEAVELYRLHGPAEAARRTGIPHGTVASWAHRAGVATSCTEERRASIEGMRLKWEERRQDMAHRMGEIANHALEVADRKLWDDHTRDAQAAVTTAAILVDKAQLLTGAAQVRVEHRHVDAVDAELAEVAAEFNASHR